MAYSAKHVPFKAAFAFVAKHHRHHKPPQGAVICIGLFSAGEMCGAAVIGRPVARRLDDGTRLELTRLCVAEGHAGAASALQARCRRVAQALGYVSLITYTLQEEGGASLRAAGATLEGEAGGGQWAKPSRPRGVSENAGKKKRWSWALNPEPAFEAPEIPM